MRENTVQSGFTFLYTKEEIWIHSNKLKKKGKLTEREKEREREILEDNEVLI